MKLRQLVVLGCAVAGAALTEQACSSGPCATTCKGCCDSSGKCQAGNTAAVCGHSGFACIACGNNTVCSAAGSCAAASCTGCVDATGQCRAGGETTACGSDGGTCATCGTTEVCFSGACQLISSCASLDAGCTFDTDCCSHFCDGTQRCGVRSLDAGPGFDAGGDAGSPDAGSDGGSDAGCRVLAFTSGTVYSTGGRPLALAVGDLNNDGWPDLVAVDNGGSVVDVLLNQHDGGFSAPAAFAVASGPDFVALGDFNGDGWLDIAVTSHGTSSVSVLFNGGDAGFVDGGLLATAAGAFGIAQGRWSGGALPDLLITNATSKASLYLNDAGSFSAAATVDAGITNGVCAMADVNGDGRPDGLVLSAGDGRLYVLLNAGDGGFGAQSSFPAAATPSAMGVGPLGPSGPLGVAVVDTSAGSVHLLLNDAGTFSQSANLSVSGLSAAIADVNSDGAGDVVVGSSSAGFTVFLSTGAIYTPFAFDGGRGTAIAVADFNRDGLPDIATADIAGTVTVFLNVCAP